MPTPSPTAGLCAVALTDLEEIRRAVFGDVGDEPNIYADYDRAVELAGKMRRAIVVLRALGEISTAAVVYVNRQNKPFGAEYHDDWTRLKRASDVFKTGDRSPDLAKEIALEGIRKCVPSRPAGRK